MILLIEDNDDDTTLMLRVLGKQLPSSAIRVAKSGVEALDLLANWGDEELHLILLDVHLPQVSGLEVLEELRKIPRARHVPVVMLSGSRNSADVIRSYDLGANSFLVKEERAEQFEATMREIVPYWLHLNHTFQPPETTS